MSVKDPMTFQQRVFEWMMACFSMEVCRDRQERNHRFLEESLELVQALGCTSSEAHQLVDYVFTRPVGEPHQELGGVMVTLAGLCYPNDLDLIEDGDRELKRVWSMIDQIRAKHNAKPKHSPLPISPVRIQRKRTKGFDLQAASPNGLPVVYVGRPGKWGNRFRAAEYGIEESLELFKMDIAHPNILADIRRELRGKNLACWCPLDQPCHADVLLKIANE